MFSGKEYSLKNAEDYGVWTWSVSDHLPILALIEIEGK